jgi:Dynein attachment factor N-terminus/Potential Monad-binding region of RPAP3
VESLFYTLDLELHTIDGRAIFTFRRRVQHPSFRPPNPCKKPCWFAVPVFLSRPLAVQVVGMDRKRLEGELATAVAKEKERTDVDNMKKRAITTAKSYEEFKNMVACASLKPLTRVDFATKAVVSANRGVGGSSAVGARFDDDLPRTTGADAIAARAAVEALASRSSASAVSGPVIRSPGEFEREWRRLPKDPLSRTGFLLQTLGPQKITAIFRREVDSLLLSDIITTLKTGLANDDAALEPLGSRGAASFLATQCLLSLSKASTWNLSVGFLSSAEKDCVSVIAQPAVDAAATGMLVVDGATIAKEQMDALAQETEKAYGLSK